MRAPVGLVPLAALAALALCSPPTAAADAFTLALGSLRDCELPPGLQARWDRGELSDPDLALALLDYRGRRPALYAPTGPPPEGVRLVPDFAPMQALHLVYPGWEDHDATYGALISAAAGQGRVRLSLLHPDAGPALDRLLAGLALPPDSVQVMASGLADTIWIRDYGPVPVQTPQGPGVLDFRYSVDCVDNDAYPTRSLPADRPLWRAPLYVDGGNLLADGAGTCFSTSALADLNHLGADELAAALSTWAGCERLVVLEPLAGTVIDHVDMLLAPAPGGVLLLAAFDPAEDPANHAVMARNRAALQAAAARDGLAWTLVDLPSPPPGPLDGAGPLVRTWTNLLPFNGVVLVPDYQGVPLDRREQAWSHIAAAFPGRSLAAVPSDPLIEQRGAVHCIGVGEPAP